MTRSRPMVGTLSGTLMQGRSRIAILCGLIVLSFAAVAQFGSQFGCQHAGVHESRDFGPIVPLRAGPIWFEHIEPRGPVSTDDVAQLVNRLTQSWTDNRRPAVSNALVRDDDEPRIVLLSISNGRTPATVAIGLGRGLVAAVDDAGARVSAVYPGRLPPTWLALDIVRDVDEERALHWNRPLDIERGLQGLAFENGSGVAFLGQELVALRLVSKQRIFRRERGGQRARSNRVATELSVFHPQSRPSVRAFTTDTFFFDGTAVQSLFRGHVRDIRIDDASLVRAISSAGRYLTNAVDRDGAFAYSYLAKQDRERDRYNMVRHAGTVFSMIQAWKVTGDPALRTATERAMSYLRSHVHPTGEGGHQAFMAYDGKIKLGGVALTALALATHARLTGTSEHIPLAIRLCRYIVAQQRTDGSFVHQRRHPDGAALSFVSQYYPGEALLALTTLYRVDPNPVWLDSAEAGARFLIQTRDRDIETSKLTHDHWLLYALDRLHRERPNELYRRHAMRIAEAIVTAQRHSGAIDHIGAYAQRPRSTPIATRNEGLLAAYRLAMSIGDVDGAKRVQDAVMRGTNVLLAMRIDEPRALYMGNPQRALGGVTRSYDNFEVRIDYVQHALSAWIALLAVIRQEHGLIGDDLSLVF